MKRVRLKKVIRVAKIIFLLLGNVEKVSNEYSIPICFIQGESDWITPTDMVGDYYDTISASSKKFVVIDNAGHTPFLDNPEQFCDEVRQFLEEN